MYYFSLIQCLEGEHLARTAEFTSLGLIPRLEGDRHSQQNYTLAREMLHCTETVVLRGLFGLSVSKVKGNQMPRGHFYVEIISVGLSM